MNDLISRQAAIDSLHMHLMYRMGTDSNKKRLDEWINNLPSAQPERKTGKWNRYYRMCPGDRFVCNRCGACFVVLQGEDKMNYCPNCGADMRGEQDE